jgi:hypothetical protein
VADTFFHREVVARAQHNNETVDVTQDTAGKSQREITHGQGISLALIMPTMMPKGPMKNMNQTKYPDKTCHSDKSKQLPRILPDFNES